MTDGEAQLWEIQRELSQLQAEEEILYRPFETLSKGEQTKALLAALFLRQGHFLLIDEPTNHLDADAKDALKKSLQEYRGTLLLICHEPEFYQDVVNEVWDMSKWTMKVF